LRLVSDLENFGGRKRGFEFGSLDLVRKYSISGFDGYW